MIRIVKVQVAQRNLITFFDMAPRNFRQHTIWLGPTCSLDEESSRGIRVCTTETAFWRFEESIAKVSKRDRDTVQRNQAHDTNLLEFHVRLDLFLFHVDNMLSFPDLDHIK